MTEGTPTQLRKDCEHDGPATLTSADLHRIHERGYCRSQGELIEYIRSKGRIGERGSATLVDALYQEIPFPGYETVCAQRTQNAERMAALDAHLDFAGKRVLDIGCNAGYFCFELAGRGARTWGIDHDQQSIVVAESLKRIHGIDQVHFTWGAIQEERLLALNQQAGAFDVILLTSVIHWLMYEFGSIRRVARLLNRLCPLEEQTIVYEPASSRTAHYPEVLDEASIRHFFELLGVTECERIGSSVASNVGQTREIWIGRRHLRKLIDAAGDPHPEIRCEVLRRAEKECFACGPVVIKTAHPDHPHYDCFVEHEAAMTDRFNAWPDLVSLHIWSGVVDGRWHLITERVHGASLEEILDEGRYGHELLERVTAQLDAFLEHLRREGLVHNDLKPQNILVDRRTRQIRIIDHEFAGVQREDGAVAGWRPFVPDDPEALALVDDLLTRVGGRYRAPHGPGNHASDRHVVHRILARMKMNIAEKLQGAGLASEGSAPSAAGTGLPLHVVQTSALDRLEPDLCNEAQTLIVMPATDLFAARRTARVLLHRAGSPCTCLIAEDDAALGFIRTVNEIADRVVCRALVYVAQDAFPSRRWLRDAVRVMGEKDAGLVAFNDGKWRGAIAGFGLVDPAWTRSLYGRGIFWPEYRAHAADYELAELARAMNRFAYCESAVLLEVDYEKDFGGGNRQDHERFDARRRSGFGGLVNPQPASIRVSPAHEGENVTK